MRSSAARGDPSPELVWDPVLSAGSPDFREHIGIFQQLVNSLPEQAALIDADTAAILVVNEAWKETAELIDIADYRPGRNYLVELAKVAAAGYATGRAAYNAVEEMRRGKRTSFRMIWDGTGRQEGQTFEARIAVLTVAGHRYIRVTRYDITELAHLRTMRDEFSVSLSNAQELERRRMGREMHDSGMQLLGAISLSLARLKLLGTDARVAAITADLEGLLFEAQREFRSISFLAHPPQVERLGLEQALRELIAGFGERAGIDNRFSVDGIVPELSADESHTLFRVAQEAISNVHRHARANTLTVRLAGRPRSLHLIVADDGCGISSDLHHGVGLRSMRSRMKELGGRLTVGNGSPGTVIHACLPITEATGAD